MKKGFLKAVFRGLVKSVPLGNTLIEIADNYKSKPILNIDSEEQKKVFENIEKPHDWTSIIIQVIITSSIIYAFVTKQISIEKLIELIIK